MHGRPRKPAKAEDLASSVAKAEKLRSLQSLLLRNHRDRIYDKEAVEVSAKLLEVNPEVYTAWNYRKLAVQHSLRSATGPEELKSIFDGELRIAEIALRRNPKCYGAWHHRKWLMKLGMEVVDYDREFRLLDQLLKADSRNFHGWNHRRFLAALKNVPEEEELKFVTDKINTNFSNYSAWHNRSVILSNLMRQKAPEFPSKEKVLMEEIELIHQALFTDPDDQSGWFYHLWLLDQVLSLDAPSLVSSWPPHGSEVVSNITAIKDCKCFHHSFPDTESFPIVLCFNEVMKGVNSTTVTVKSAFVENENLIWKPLSVRNSMLACSWATHLKIPDLACNIPSSYLVEVSLGHSPSLVSASGRPFSNAMQFAFTLKVKTRDSECTEGNCKRKMKIVDWSGANFCINETFCQNNFLAVSFEQLSITESATVVSKWHTDTLSNEINLFRELMSEISCKISKLTLARLLTARCVNLQCGILSSRKSVHFVEILQLYDDLTKMDTSHSGYYKDQRSLVQLDQITSDRENFAKHCWDYKEINSSIFGNNAYVRFTGLSLTRMGSIERLLWVNMLDLSHNELQSIEGLEALQILVHLNLSHNKIGSITALEPLKMLSSLRVLDVSYNEIGAHSIDTTRYLCASPLSHAIGSTRNIEDFENFYDGKLECWEAVLVFKELHLKQLDMLGNPAFNDSFCSILSKLIPCLEFLNGKHIAEV